MGRREEINTVHGPVDSKYTLIQINVRSCGTSMDGRQHACQFYIVKSNEDDDEKNT